MEGGLAAWTPVDASTPAAAAAVVAAAPLESGRARTAAPPECVWLGLKALMQAMQVRLLHA